MRSPAILSKRALFHMRRWAFALAKPAASMARARSAFLVIASLTVAACSPFSENKMIERGIGTGLYTSDVQEESRLLNLYLRNMCVQGGLGSFNGENMPACDPDTMDASFWTILVRAGFNDIDRRCDSYLAWLNSKRRTNKSILTQLSQTATATLAIMEIAESSASSLALVGVAFGLARDTFTNYYSRLLLEIESSTVELVVTGNRQKFREAFNETRVLYKPDAVHILRSYLLICTPHVIENNINTRTRFSVAGNLPPPQDSFGADVNKSTLSKSAMVRQTAPVKSTEKVKRPVRIRDEVPELKGSLIDKEMLMKAQAYLCVEPQSGIYGPKTIEAVKIWEQVNYKKPDDEFNNGSLDRSEATTMINLPACGPGFKNPQERDIFGDDLTKSASQRTLEGIKRRMIKKAEELNVAAAGSVNLTIPQSTNLVDLRPEIAKLKKAMNLSETSTERAYLNEQITPEFYNRLIN